MTTELIRIAAAAVIVSSAAFVLYYLSHRRDERPRHTVSLPLAAIPFGSVAAAFFAGITIAHSFDDDFHWAYAAGYGIFVLLGLALEIAPLTVKITYDSTGFTSRNFFGVSRTFSWRDVTEISSVRKDTVIYLGNKRVRVDDMSDGVGEFVDYLRKQYRTLNGGLAVPARGKNKRTIYKGNVRNPILMTTLFLVPTLVLDGFFIGLLVTDPTVGRDELTSVTASFARTKEEEEDLILYAGAGEDAVRYKISEYEEYTFNTDAMIQAVEAGEEFAVSYSECDGYSDIYEMRGMDGTAYVTLDSANEHVRLRKRSNVFLMGLLCGAFTIFFAVMILAARHPERFGRRFMRLTWGDQFVSQSRRR